MGWDALSCRPRLSRLPTSTPSNGRHPAPAKLPLQIPTSPSQNDRGSWVGGLLPERNAKAQSHVSKECYADKALAKRQKRLNKLAALAAHIPPEVLAPLPSQQEIG